jgi:hypothetical protein
MSTVDSIITKHLISAEIQVLEAVITLARVRNLDKVDPIFMEKLLQFRAKCDEDLMEASK